MDGWNYIAQAFGISLLGSLPLGNLNVVTADLAARKSFRAALWFALGVVMTEMGYLWATLHALGWFAHHGAWFRWLQGLGVAVMLLLAGGYFWTAIQVKAAGATKTGSIGARPLISGLLLSAMNPIQIPFWAGWATTLGLYQTNESTETIYIIFTAGAGMGTYAALMLFAVLGHSLTRWMALHFQLANVLFGLLMLAIAAWQGWQIATR